MLVLITSICIAGGFYGSKAVKQLVFADPMESMRFDPKVADKQPPAFIMTNSIMRSYVDGVLVHEANVGEISTTGDRSMAVGKNISQGKIFDKGKLVFNYSADNATWNDANKRLDVAGGMRLYNTDMDLKSEIMLYLQPENQMTVNKPVSGKFYGGKITTANLEFNFGTKKYSMKNIVWQGKPNAKVEGLSEDRKQRQWTIKAKESSGGVDDKEEYFFAEATDGEIIIKANKVVRDVKTDVLVATGQVRYFGPDANILCEKVTIYRKERRAVCEGGRVTMLIKPKDEAKLKVEPLTPMRPIVPEEIANIRPPAPRNSGEDEVRSSSSVRKYPVTVIAAKIEYFYKKGERRAIISGDPQARQTLGSLQWRHVWAHQALYNGETEELRLTGKAGTQSVRSKNSRGDDVKAKTITIFTKRDVERWRAEEMEVLTYPEDEEDISIPATEPGKGEKPPGLTGSI